NELEELEALIAKILPKGIDLVLDINRRTINPIRTIFDVGANIGQTAQYYHQQFPEAKILSFEPVAETFRILESNTKKLSRVHCFNNGFGEHDQKMKIFLKQDSGNNSLVDSINIDQNLGGEIIDVKTIDGFCKLNNVNNIDLLKTDAEGYDLQVIKGAEDYLNAKKISFILSEVGFYKKDSGHTFFMDLHDYLIDKDYQLVDLYDTTPAFYLPNKFGFCNALFIDSQIAQEWCKWKNNKWRTRY
ncbi:MAG: FkbM family methyltransferase, partial [Dolichospermum sp.]|nr:FkbM family methyltransferase [Dolichospermum sp.]